MTGYYIVEEDTLVEVEKCKPAHAEVEGKQDVKEEDMRLVLESSLVVEFYGIGHLLVPGNSDTKTISFCYSMHAYSPKSKPAVCSTFKMIMHSMMWLTGSGGAASFSL